MAKPGGVGHRLGLDANRLGDEDYVRTALIAALGQYLDNVQFEQPHGPAFQQLMHDFVYLANVTGLHWAAVLQSALLTDQFKTRRGAR